MIGSSVRNGKADDVFIRRGGQLRAYRPSMMGGAYLNAFIDGKPAFTLWYVDRMRRDPMVQFCLRVLRAPLTGMKVGDHGIDGQPTIQVKSDSPEVQAFVESQLHLLWTTSLRKVLKFLEWGFSAGEQEFTEADGGFSFETLRDANPLDCLPLQWIDGPEKGSIAGISVKSRGVLDTEGKHYIYAPHAFWCAGESEFGSLLGRPRLADMYLPWLEKQGRNGACDSRRLWYRKNAFRGGQLYYPLGTTDYGTEGAPEIHNNQDIAREIVEKQENGGVMALPNSVNSENPAKYKWDFIPATSQADLAGMIDYPKTLDEDIQYGAGIPPEIVKTAAGGGLGRSISLPGVVFFAGEDELVQIVLTAFDQQTIKPLVIQRFGERAKYSIQAESLAALAQKDPAAANKTLAGATGPDGLTPMNAGQRGGEATAVQMAVDASGREHKGKGPGGGQFAKGDGGSAESIGDTKSKPHFIGSDKNPSSFFVIPDPKGGKAKELYQRGPEYVAAVGKHTAEVASEEARDTLNEIDDIAHTERDEDDEEGWYASMRDQIEEKAYAVEENAHAIIDRWQTRIEDSLSGRYESNHDTAALAKKFDEAKKDISEAIHGKLGPIHSAYEEMDESNWEPEIIEDRTTMANNSISSTFDELRDAINDHEQAINAKIEEEAERDEDAGRSAAEEMIDQFGNDNSGTAEDYAAELNAKLAKADSQYRVYYNEDSEGWAFEYGEDLEDYPGKDDEPEKPIQLSIRERRPRKRIPKAKRKDPAVQLSHALVERVRALALTEFPEIEPVELAKDAGRWITLGAKEGKGGSPVFIQNGRITKGAPGLTGKNIANLKEAAPDQSRQADNKQYKEHAKATILKQARKEGIHPDHVHALASDIHAHHKELTSQHNAMLKDARTALDAHGKQHRMMSANDRLGEDSASIPGLDLVAREIAGRYPGILDGALGYGADDVNDFSKDAAEKLHEYLQEGTRQHLTEEEAYAKALDTLLEDKHSGNYDPKRKDDEVPF